jgi:SAM-dependent methyltransferase
MNQHAHAPHAHDLDWAAMVTFAELEAEVLLAFLAEATTVLADLTERKARDVRRILDVGSGPGVGTCVLAERFAAATVVAADGSPEMLANVAARAERLGLAARVQTRLVELPDGLDGMGPADLVWASMVLHHVGDEAGALRRLRSRLEPGGLLGLAEFADPLRFVADDAGLGRPGVWERLDAARASWLADMRAGLPDAQPAGDYPTMLRAAGFEVVVDRVIRVELEPPLTDPPRRMALGHLKLMREHAEPYAEAGDLELLDALVDEDQPDCIMRRPDALLHASRRLLVARAVDGSA